MDELQCHAERRGTRQDAYGALLIGEEGDNPLESGSVEAGQGARHVAFFGQGVAAHKVTLAEPANPFHGREQLRGEFVLDRSLQFDEAVVAQFGGEPHHGGGPCACGCCDIGNGAEGDDLW